MFKIYIYKNGKILNMFNGKTFKDESEYKLALKYWYETRRSDQSGQFLIVDENERMIQIINKEDM